MDDPQLSSPSRRFCATRLTTLTPSSDTPSYRTLLIVPGCFRLHSVPCASAIRVYPLPTHNGPSSPTTRSIIHPGLFRTRSFRLLFTASLTRRRSSPHCARAHRGYPCTTLGAMLTALAYELGQYLISPSTRSPRSIFDHSPIGRKRFHRGQSVCEKTLTDGSGIPIRARGKYGTRIYG